MRTINSARHQKVLEVQGASFSYLCVIRQFEEVIVGHDGRRQMLALRIWPCDDANIVEVRPGGEYGKRYSIGDAGLVDFAKPDLELVFQAARRDARKQGVDVEVVTLLGRLCRYFELDSLQHTVTSRNTKSCFWPELPCGCISKQREEHEKACPHDEIALHCSVG